MWTENWLNYLVQKLLAGSPSGSQLPALCPSSQHWFWNWFNIFINDLNDGTSYTTSKSAEGRKPGGVVDSKDMLREKWANGNLMDFNKGKWKVLHLGRKNSMHQYVLWACKLESMSRQYALAAKVSNRQKVNSCIRRSVASRPRLVHLPLYSAMVKYIWSDESNVGLLSTREKSNYFGASMEGLLGWLRDWSTCHLKRDWESCDWAPWRWGDSGWSYPCV